MNEKIKNRILKQEHSAKKKEFDRRIFTAKTFFQDLFFLMTHVKEIYAAMKNEELGKKFMEKIMIVVTAVNGCTYCTWFHAKQAVATGISKEETKNIFQLQFKANAQEHELFALLFAQHYAETNRQPEADMSKKLIELYGTETAQHIIMFIHMIWFGNLSGNTFDAFLSRFKGIKASNSCIFFEFFFFIVNLPFMLPILPFVRKHQKLSNKA